MSNFLGLADSWIAYELSADTTMQTLIGDKFYLGIAPEDQTGVYAIYNNVSSLPKYNLGIKRDFSWAEYDIVAYEVGALTADLKTVADQIDAMFSKFKARLFNGYVFHSRVVAEISRSNREQTETQWRGLGGTYRISIAKE